MKLGTPLSPAALKVMLLGSGELGRWRAVQPQMKPASASSAWRAS
jgi:formate-dependent phosphoribosylglycinamide formyltransferase (GAR transformylase)